MFLLSDFIINHHVSDHVLFQCGILVPIAFRLLRHTQFVLTLKAHEIQRTTHNARPTSIDRCKFGDGHKLTSQTETKRETFETHMQEKVWKQIAMSILGIDLEWYPNSAAGPPGELSRKVRHLGTQASTPATCYSLNTLFAFLGLLLGLILYSQKIFQLDNEEGSKLLFFGQNVWCNTTDELFCVNEKDHL